MILGSSFIGIVSLKEPLRILPQYNFLRIRRGAVRMDDNDGVTLVQGFHQRVQRLIAQVLPRLLVANFTPSAPKVSSA